MKLGFWTLGTPGWSNQQVVDIASGLGFQGVDLRCASNGNISLDSSRSEVDALRSLFAGAGLEIASLLAYNPRGGEDGVDWSSVRDGLAANAELAARLGTGALRVNAGCPARDSTWDSYLEGLAAALQATLEAVDGVELLVQNHPGSLTAAQATRLVELTGSPRAGIGLSPDHCVDMGEDALAMTRQVASRVRQVHLADRVALAGGGLKACLPGEGIVPNREVLACLQEHGFEGWVSFKWEKPTYPDLPDAHVALPRFLSFMSSVS